MGEGAKYRVKASVLRAHLKWLEHEHLLDAVIARMSLAHVNVIKSPPLASSWMESAALDEVVEHLENLAGLEGVRRLARDTLRTEMSPMLAPMVRGVMRVIGGSPRTLYSRMGDLVRTVIKDVDYVWTSTSEKSGTLEIRYPNATNVPMRTFVSAIAGVENMLVLCNTTGTVAEPVKRGNNAAIFAIQWK